MSTRHRFQLISELSISQLLRCELGNINLIQEFAGTELAPSGFGRPTTPKTPVTQSISNPAVIDDTPKVPGHYMADVDRFVAGILIKHGTGLLC